MSDASKSSWWPNVITTVVSVVASVGAAYLVADRTSDAALETQRLANAAVERQESREKRAQVYAAFVDAANDYLFDSIQARSCVYGFADRNSSETTLPADCNEHVADLASSRSELQGAYRDVWVWGSDAAVRAADDYKDDLPPTDDFSPITGLPDLNHILGRDSPRAALRSSSYDAFLDVMCRELPARPRPGCHP